MANCSDAFGTITVKAVGKEFVEFLKTVQEGAYYTLTRDENLEDLELEDDMEFEFCSDGRWAFSSNTDGYLNGDWMDNDDKCRDAYAKFIAAMKEKNGLVRIDYQDSDTAMDWMGYGYAELSVDDDGEICYSQDFIEERITLKRFAEMQGETIEWAFAYLYGDEVLTKYEEYVEQWHKDHSGPECEGMDPVCLEEWYDNEYQEEEE